MALLMIEGFDTQWNTKQYWEKLSYVTTTEAGRFGGYALQGNATATIASLPTPADTLVVGAAMKPRVSGITAGNLFEFYAYSSSTLVQFIVGIAATGRIHLQRGSTVVQQPDPVVMSPGVWAYVEVKIRLHDTAGSCVVRVNGVEVANFTGDTLNSSVADARVSRVGFTNRDGVTDDVYMCDTTGTALNDFLGDVAVETLSPNGSGAFSQLAGSDGNSTDNYQLVDEIPATSADYVQSSTPGARDTYQFTNPSGLGKILAVQPNIVASQTSPGAAYIRDITRLPDGTEREGASKPTSATALWVPCGPYVTDPAGQPWTVPSLSGAEFGVEVE